MNSLGERVRAFRLAQRPVLSTAALAKAVRTNRQSIEGLEAGVVEQPRYIVELARVMGLSADELLGAAANRRTHPESVPMTIERELKQVSAADIEKALAKGLSELLGREYTVSVGKIDFAGPAALAGRVPLEIVVSPATNPKLPF